MLSRLEVIAFTAFASISWHNIEGESPEAR